MKKVRSKLSVLAKRQGLSINDASLFSVGLFGREDGSGN